MIVHCGHLSNFSRREEELALVSCRRDYLPEFTLVADDRLVTCMACIAKSQFELPAKWWGRIGEGG